MFHVEWRPCEPQWIQILWLKIRCGEKWNTNRRNWGWQRAENIGALMWKYMFFMWIDLDVKFVSINSLFKRPHDKSFCFIPVPLVTRTVLYYFTCDMTMHDQMAIVVKCWPFSIFLLHLQLALQLSSFFHSLSSLVMFSKLMLAQINLKREWLYWCNPGFWIKSTSISAIANNLS